MGCARELAKHDDVRVSLIDRNNYHQFQPLLYQVATSQLAPSDIAYSLRKLFHEDDRTSTSCWARSPSLDLAGHAVTTADGMRVAGDVLVLAAGSRPNFFRTKGAEEQAFPLYSLDDALRLRSRILGVFEDGRQRSALVEQGALNFVVVGGGPTGVELAGALADLIHETMTTEYHHLAVTAAQVHLVDLGSSLLGPFSDSAHEYASKVLERKGVRLHLGVAVTEIGPGHVTLADGTTIATRCVVWGGGIMAPQHHRRRGPPARARGAHRRRARPQRRRAARRVRRRRRGEHPGARRRRAPPARVGRAAERRVGRGQHPRRRRAASPAKPFHYHDKGIMAMIGRGAAIAEVGAHRHELHGVVAFSAWLGVHSALMLGVRNRIDAFVAWGWDNFSSARGPQVLDRSDAARSTGARTRSRGPVRRRHDDARRHDGRPGPRAVRDDVAVPLPVRPADAGARAARRDHADRLVPHRRRRLAAVDEVLRRAAADQLRHRRGDRAGAGVPVRDELVGVLGATWAASSARRWRSRGSRRSSWRPRSSASGSSGGTGSRPACISRRSGSSRSARGCRRTSSSSRTRGCSTPSARRSTTARRSSRTSWDLLGSRFAIYAFTHTMLVGVTAGSLVVLGVSCWHLVRGRNVELFRRSAALALVVAVPVTFGQPHRRQPVRRRRAPTTSR